MVRLSNEDILFFKREGYLIKRKVLNPDLMARARNRLWEGAPPSMDRYVPETWAGPIKKEEECEDTMNRKGGFRWNFREPGGRRLDGSAARHRSKCVGDGGAVSG